MNITFSAAAYLTAGLIAVPTLLLRPHLIIYLLILTTLFRFLGLFKFSLGHINFYTNDLIVLCYSISSMIFILGNLIQRKREPLSYLTHADRYLLTLVLAYIGLHFTYALLAFAQGVSLDSVIRRFDVYGDCLYFFLPIFFLRNKDQLHRVLLFVVFLSVLYPAWQVYVFATSHGHHMITSSGTVRLAGSQPTPILACAVFALLIWKRGLSQYVLVSFPILALCLVGHRSVFLSLAFGLAFLFFFLRDIAKPILFAYLASFFLILVSLFINFATGHDFISDIVTRSIDTFSSSDQNTLARAYSIRDNFVVFISHPLFGIGYDHEGISRLLVTEEAVFNILHPHNFIMRHLSHTGIIGTLLIVLIIARLLSKCYTIAREIGDNQYIAIFLFCSFIFFLMVSLMNTEFFSHGFVFWILGGTTVFYSERAMVAQDTASDIANR